MSNEHEGDGLPRRAAISRMMLGGGAVLAGVTAGGTVAAVSRAGAGAWRREELVVDIAILGETWRDSSVNYAADEADFRGYPFSVEGYIYPENHIGVPGDGFVPSASGSIGRWLCRGHTLVHSGRIEPHVQSIQEFVFGPMTPENLFADNNLTTSGTEGSFETNQAANRAIIGGTGIYIGAAGQAQQSLNGFNTTVFTDGTGSAPNLHMSFDLIIPNL